MQAKTTDTWVEKLVTRGNLEYDIIDSRRVSKILLVCQNPIPSTIHIYESGPDFMLYTHNKIRWIGNDKPTESSQYSIIYIVQDVSNQQYNIDNCPVCGGNGWYAGIIDEVTGKFEIVSGIDKLTQDVIKFILTVQKGNYGTTLKSIIGKNMSNESALREQITSTISIMEQQYKETQASAIMEGMEVSDSELLDYIYVSELEIDSEAASVYITIHAYSVSRESAKVTLKV